MAELAAGPRGLAVIVVGQPVDFEQARAVGHGAQEIDHRAMSEEAGAAERQVADRAQVILKLDG